MGDVASSGPFDDHTVAEIPLGTAPLIRVFCQVAWPELTVLNNAFSEIAGKLGALLADEYPSPSRSEPVQITIDVSGDVKRQDSPPVHRFSSSDEKWSVYLATTFLTLESRAYTSKTDMTARFEFALKALSGVADIPASSRVGFRYVNRVDGADYLELKSFVHDSVLGAGAIPLPEGVAMEHALSQALFLSDTGNLMATWGLLPPGQTHDPAVQPSETKAWVLDLDAFRESRSAFDPATIAEQSRELSALAYKFFRWSVKSEFLSRFGGDV